MFRFENLDVWQEAMNLCERIYRVSQSFPAAEQYGLTSQVRRSVVSISANIAEGAGRGTDPEFVRFLDIATGSLMETVSHWSLASRLQFISESDFREVYEQCERIGKMISSLRNRLRNKP